MNDLQPRLFLDFAEYIDRGEQTTRTYINNLRQFAAWLRHEEIRQPTRRDLLAYREYLLSEHDAIICEGAAWQYRTDRSGNRIRLKCRPTTAAQYLRSVRQFFQWTAQQGLYPDIAANLHGPRIDTRRHRKDALAPKDVQRIRMTIEAGTPTTRRAGEQQQRLLCMFLLAVTAGLRTIEISRANVGDLEERNGDACLYIWGKGHADPDTRKPLAKEVYAEIRNYLRNREAPATAGSPLFVATGNRSGGRRLASTTISTMLKKAMQAAGYDSDRLTAHSLRHTAGTAAQAISGNLYTTQQYMRHTNPATTEIYIHLANDREQAGLAQEIYDLYARNPSGGGESGQDPLL